ncbi:RNA-binding protein [Paenactinomyces guangxiensis]|uniref:RNA-binding protein n=1 Tax=Paenactinomyces guangxiensis TaxID=1490290 RepID=A0A7W1WQX7_9BACL|nr:YlmH/Sll1252 family protein [Paenactinomyces guangxiensis]MBA4494231.1 RNA-binding protein [Paenactinomyces guangxiensis]MBH8590727.1 RNA-binding protein [Paenactinomyces guangxiensis]
MTNRESAIFAHFRRDEKPFVERSLDWIERALDKYQPVTTPFLDPREQYILRTLVQREPELLLLLDGGYSSAERCRAVVGPSSYLRNDPRLFRLSFLRLETKSGKPLEHSDVLGTILGLGIKREKVGDLHPHQSGCDIVIAEEMCEFVHNQLGQVGREHVNISKIARNEFILTEQKYSVRAVTLPSLRVDALVSEGYRISRAKAAAWIKNGKCKVNWKVVDQPDYPVEAGDLISLRGYGRIRIMSLDGLTKKRRNLVKIASFI